MKKLSLFLVTLLGFPVFIFAQDELSSKIESVPLVYQVAGSNEASLVPARYPEFTDFKSNFPACEKKLKELSLTKINGRGEPAPVPDLALTINVPEVYRNSNNSILIVWTLRVEGESVKVNAASLCSQWWGTVTEKFRSGNVYSQAYVDYGDGFQPQGQELGMTIPEGLDITVVTPPPSHDPTHSGSFLLKPPAGGFPATIKVKIYWRNDTCMKVFSKANYRSLIVSLLPQEKK